MDIEKINRVKTALMTIQRFQWEQGVTAQALIELGGFRDEVIMLVKAAMERSKEDGRLGAMENNIAITDPACLGEPILYAIKETGDEKIQESLDKLLNYMLHTAPRNDEGIYYHLNIFNQFWVDAYYMAPPFLALTGHYDEAIKQIEGFRKYLWSSENKLFSHKWDDDAKKFEREVYWATGNGWAAAGMTRVIKALPESMSEDRDRLIGYVKEVIDGFVAYQREDGMFHDELDNPESFLEGTGGMMISYSIYRGIAAGWLDSSYVVYADKLKEAMNDRVDEFGFLHDVGGMPHFVSPGFSSEAQAFFLLMEAAARDLKSLKK